MTLRLPEAVKNVIRVQYRRAIDRAIENYPLHAAKEDAISGSLAHTLGDVVTGSADGHTWSTRVVILGSGKAIGRQQEPELGADFVIEIRYRTPGGRRQVKAILVQAKRRGDSDSKRLMDQCTKMGKLPGEHIAVEYHDTGFTAFSANHVVRNGGSLAKSRAYGEPLEDALGGDFLACRIGQLGMTYDPTKYVLNFPETDGKTHARFTVRVQVVTSVSSP